MFGIATWLSQYDQFGSIAQFNYRGRAGYGTGLGGCCSIIITAMVAGFIFLQLCGFFLTPAWNQNTTVDYLNSQVGDKAEPYDIEVGNFVPAYYLFTHHEYDGEEYMAINDSTLFDFYFAQDNENAESQVIYEAINCVEYINSDKWDGYSDAERQNALAQIDAPDSYLCPNVDVITLEGGMFGSQWFTFYVVAKEGTSNDMINDTRVYQNMISRYFTPDSYSEMGFMPWIAVNENIVWLKAKQVVENAMYIESNNILRYWFSLVDTSQISLIDMSEHFCDYKVESEKMNYAVNYENKLPSYKNTIMQSRRYNEVVWSINSLDLILGLVGGVTGILWAGCGFLIAPYEEFKFLNSLIGSIYPTSPQRDEDEPPIASRDEAKESLEQTVSERGKFYYQYFEYRLVSYLHGCCCCLMNKKSIGWKKRDFKLQRYEKAVERLNEEIDILKHVANQRQSAFLCKLILRKHQRALVNSFQRYQLDDMIAEDEAEKRKEKNVQKIANSTNIIGLLNADMQQENSDIVEDPHLSQAQKQLILEIREKFDPVEIVADLCILYEVTDYKDQSADKDFWEQYDDFAEVGMEDMLVRQNKLGERDRATVTKRTSQIAGVDPETGQLRDDILRKLTQVDPAEQIEEQSDEDSESEDEEKTKK